MPRSGSSMVAGLFAKHGVFSGTPYGNRLWENEPCYENRPVKRHLIQTYGRLEMGPAVPVSGGAEILPMIEADGWTGGPWMFKGSAMYWRAFEQLNPWWVTIRRPRESIEKSVKRDKLPVDIDGHIAILDRLENEYGALRIDTPPLVIGQYRQVADVFAKIGLEFDPDIADGFVKPKLWHS